MTDFYVTLDCEWVGDVYKCKLIKPINIAPGVKLYVAMCTIAYKHDFREFQNLPEAKFEIAMPRYSGTKNNVDTTPQTDISAKSDISPNDEPESRSSLTFIRCSLENGEYSPQKLCKALNTEIKNKFPSSFQQGQCEFQFNECVQRVELRIDGSDNISPPDRVTLIVYYPLSYKLGFTLQQSYRATFCFVSKREREREREII